MTATTPRTRTTTRGTRSSARARTIRSCRITISATTSGASDGDASEDSRGSDDESDGEDLMNDMERCGSDASDARRARARTGTGRGFEYLNFELSLARGGDARAEEDARRAARGARRDGGDGVERRIARLTNVRNALFSYGVGITK